jgi:hypothetical protein
MYSIKNKRIFSMETTLKDYRDSTLKVKDMITGFEGIVTGHADYVTGCDQYLVQPPVEKDKPGGFIEPRWFDEKRLEIIEVTVEGVHLLKKVAQARALNDDGADVQAPTK